MILFHFTGEVTGGSLNLEEDGILDSKWIKLNDLMKFDNIEIREASVLKKIVDNLLKENLYSN